jgi:hypothetical protein
LLRGRLPRAAVPPVEPPSKDEPRAFIGGSVEDVIMIGLLLDR